MSDNEDLQAIIDAALKIHAPFGTRMGSNLRWVDPRCQECETRWPCRTVTALTSKVQGHIAKSGPQ